MTSQGAVKQYSLSDFEEEVKNLGPFSITSKLATLKDWLQKNKEDAIKTEAKSLKEEIDQKGTKGLSEEGNTFLKRLIQYGSMLQSVDPKSRITNTPVKNPAVDNKVPAQQSVPKGPEKVEKMSKSGQGQLSKTVLQVGQASDSGTQPNFAATMPFPGRAHEMETASGNNPKLEDVVRMINKFLVAEDSVVPGSLHTPELEVVLKNIAKLKDEKKRVTQLYEAQTTMVGTQEEKIKSMDKRIKEHCTEMQDLEKKFNDHSHQLEQENTMLKQSNGQLEQENSKLRQSNGQFEAYVNQTKAENHQLRSYADEMQTNVSRLDQKLRKSREEIEGLKQQLVQQAEDNARQKQKLSEEMHRLHSDNKQLKSRISELAGAKLMDNNPDIADLSDPNRAMKLGEKFSSLYDDEWTDHFQIFTEKFKMKDDEAIEQLLQILLKTYDFCRKVGDGQMDSLCNLFEHPCQDISQAMTMKPQADKLQMTQKHHKELKDLRKKIALKQVDSISKQYLAKENEEAKKGDKKLKQILDETKPYYEKCVEVCWPMVLHDPPLRMEMKAQSGAKIDPNRYRLYGGNGDTLEYLVWPPLQVEGGGLIAKGVAKPKKVPRTPKK